MSSLQAICRTYADNGTCTPRGTLSVVPIPGSSDSFQATLSDRGHETDLPVIVLLVPQCKHRHYAILAQAFRLLSER